MYDIYCIAYIINLIVKDILKGYLLKSAAEEELSNYTNTLTTAINTSSHIKVKGLTNKIQRIAIIKIAGVASFVIPRRPFATLRGAPFLTFAPGNFGVGY